MARKNLPDEQRSWLCDWRQPSEVLQNHKDLIKKLDLNVSNLHGQSSFRVITEVLLKCVEKKVKKSYPIGEYSLLIYLDRYMLHPEDRVNRKVLLGVMH